MDKDTAVRLLKAQDTLEERNDDKKVYWCLTNKKACAIADYIEQQEKRIKELEKDAALGRLVIEAINSGYTEICISSSVMDSKCEDCGWFTFCLKRSELLAEVKRDGV